MADINEILGRNISSVKELKGAINDLKNSLIGVDTESEQFKTTSAQLAAAQAELNKVTKAGTEDNNAAADSIVGMQKEYKKLYDAYKMLTEEQRNSDFGKNMAASLEELSKKLNDTKKDVGNFKDNIGRYAESASEAFNGMGVSIGGLQTPLKLATGGANTFGTALKALAANPIVLVITALVAILAKAAEAIKKNEELTNRLQVAMSALKPITDALANVFDFLANMIVKAIEGMSKAVEWISRINPKWNAAVKSHQELAKATNELTKAQRENSVVASQKGAEIERLREEASATDDVIEKKRLLEEAKKLQQEVDQREIELAQEELRIMEAYADKTANSAEDNEKLAAAQKKVNDAIAKGEQNMRMYNKQLNSVDSSVKKTTTSTKNYQDEAKKLYDQLQENNKTEITKITEKYEKEKKLLQKYHLDTKLLTEKYYKDLFAIEERERQERYSKELNAEKRHRDAMKQLRGDSLSEEIAETVELKRNLEGVTEIFQGMVNTFQENGLKEPANFIQKVFNEGDWSKITDFQEALKLAPEFETFLKNLGEVDYTKMMTPIADHLQRIKTLFGVTVENVQDLQDQLTIIAEKSSKEIAEKATVEYIDTIEKTANEEINKANIKILEALLGGDEEAGKSLIQESLKLEFEELVKEKEALEKVLFDSQSTGDTQFQLSYETRIALQEKYISVMEEISNREKALQDLSKQRTIEMINNLIDMTDNLGNALGTIRSSYESLIDSEVKAGKIDDKEAKNKKKRLIAMQKAETAFKIATIAADAALSIYSIWKAWGIEQAANASTAAAAGPILGPPMLASLNAKSLISAIAKTTSLAGTAAAQIAAARNGVIAAENNFNDGGASSSAPSVAATPALVDNTPYSYTKTVQTVEEEQQLNQPIYVTVTDIEEGLGQRVKVTDETSF